MVVFESTKLAQIKIYMHQIIVKVPQLRFMLGGRLQESFYVERMFEHPLIRRKILIKRLVTTI